MEYRGADPDTGPGPETGWGWGWAILEEGTPLLRGAGEDEGAALGKLAAERSDICLLRFSAYSLSVFS